MLDKLYYLVVCLIEKFGSPRETYGKESEEVLELKKYYEEQAKDEKNSDGTNRS